jgi:hypothetical protein
MLSRNMLRCVTDYRTEPSLYHGMVPDTFAVTSGLGFACRRSSGKGTKSGALALYRPCSRQRLLRTGCHVTKMQDREALLPGLHTQRFPSWVYRPLPRILLSLRSRRGRSRSSLFRGPSAEPRRAKYENVEQPVVCYFSRVLFSLHVPSPWRDDPACLVVALSPIVLGLSCYNLLLYIPFSVSHSPTWPLPTWSGSSQRMSPPVPRKIGSRPWLKPRSSRRSTGPRTRTSASSTSTAPLVF